MTNTPHSIIEQPDERGTALIAVLLLLMMMSALAAALGVAGQTETLISRNQRSSAQAQAAAEAGLNHAVELATTYIFEWKANELDSAAQAVDYLLIGPDLASGTTLTDVDNRSLDARTGIEEAEAIPLDTDGTERLAIGVNAEYTAIIMDDDTAPDEDGDPFNDANETLIVRATGYGPDNTIVVLEAALSPIELPALVTDGDLDIQGNVAIAGTEGDVHSNGDLTVSGVAATVTGTVTASGTYTGILPGSGGAAELPLPQVRAIDYRPYADFILTSGGTMTNLAGTVLCIWTMATPCNVGWNFDSGTGAWSIGSTAPTGGTYYVQGRVNITGSPGSAIAPVPLTLIAEGSIDISGSPDITADTPELLFVTDGDLEISGGLSVLDPLTVGGQILVHEQLKLSGNLTLTGQLIVEDAPSVDPLVTANAISGNVAIIYNGGLGDGFYSVTGWRDIRE